ncbi:hypothetical protein KJN74_04755 [Candidatus Bathyarchaeota archaeon]|nr:hypothetical protein [Candidatus Bathyarchaeota archaeon]
MTKKWALAYLIFTLLVLSPITSHQVFSQEIIPQTLVLTVYPDGFVFVNYVLIVDQTFPTQNITVFGQVLEDLLVLDYDGLPLGYSLKGSTLSVYSLGKNEIGITYLTQDLTSKEGKIWTLTLDAPLNTRIILPLEAAIINLNKVPEMIETNNDKVTLLMNASSIEVSYVIGIVGTKEYAQIVLNDAETTIIQIQSLDIIITGAKTKLQEAEDAFSHGNYAEAETLGNEAKNLAVQTNQTAIQATLKIVEAENAIANTEVEESLELIEAQNLLDQAKSAYDRGDYSESLSLAAQAITKAENSTISLAGDFPILEIFGAILVLVSVVLCIFLVKSRRKPKEVESHQKKRRIDVKRIFKQHKNLISEEKQAIQFLVNNNGEAFEADLYDYVKLPRTTTWRMVKRLKTMGIISVTKFRRQNLVRLKTKYDIKE